EGGATGNTGIVHQYVKTAKTAQYIVSQCRNCVAVGDIERMAFGNEAFRGQRIGLGLGCRAVDINENDARALLCRAGRNRRSQPPACTGDEDELFFQKFYFRFPWGQAM
ncbi:hypothetical protein B997_02069, partial [Brucella melitensis UK3/06]